jgi:hypothetical protein
VSSPNSRANNVATPTRPIRACKRFAVTHDEDILDSDDEDMGNDEPHTNAPPPRTRKNTPILYESLMASHRLPKERHMTTRTDLKCLKREHESTVTELHCLK